MKIFVTGATGYIGQRLTLKLIEYGHEIHVLCRNRPAEAWAQNRNLKFFYGDITDPEIIVNSMRGCEQVFHLAAYARVWATNPETYFKINVQGTVNVLEAAQQCGVKKIVFTSSGGTFGTSNGTPIQEEMVRTIDFFTEYESSKFMAEEKIQHYVRRGLNVVIVNPVRVYGPGLMTKSNALSYMIKSYVSGDWHIIPGTGKTVSCFTFIDDVVTGHLLAMEKGRPGEKYILGGENINFNQFFSKLREISHKRFFLVKLPMALLLLFGWKEELLAKWFNREPIITRSWIKKNKYHSDCSSDKAIRELGYKITSIEDGIAKTLEWLYSDQRA